MAVFEDEREGQGNDAIDNAVDTTQDVIDKARGAKDGVDRIRGLGDKIRERTGNGDAGTEPNAPSVGSESAGATNGAGTPNTNASVGNGNQSIDLPKTSGGQNAASGAQVGTQPATAGVTSGAGSAPAGAAASTPAASTGTAAATAGGESAAAAGSTAAGSTAAAGASSAGTTAATTAATTAGTSAGGAAAGTAAGTAVAPGVGTAVGAAGGILLNAKVPSLSGEGTTVVKAIAHGVAAIVGMGLLLLLIISMTAQSLGSVALSSVINVKDTPDSAWGWVKSLFGDEDASFETTDDGVGGLVFATDQRTSQEAFEELYQGVCDVIYDAYVEKCDDANDKFDKYTPAGDNGWRNEYIDYNGGTYNANTNKVTPASDTSVLFTKEDMCELMASYTVWCLVNKKTNPDGEEFDVNEASVRTFAKAVKSVADELFVYHISVVPRDGDYSGFEGVPGYNSSTKSFKNYVPMKKFKYPVYERLWNNGSDRNLLFRNFVTEVAYEVVQFDDSGNPLRNADGSYKTVLEEIPEINTDDETVFGHIRNTGVGFYDGYSDTRYSDWVYLGDVPLFRFVYTTSGSAYWRKVTDSVIGCDTSYDADGNVTYKQYYYRLQDFNRAGGLESPYNGNDGIASYIPAGSMSDYNSYVPEERRYTHLLRVNWMTSEIYQPQKSYSESQKFLPDADYTYSLDGVEHTVSKAFSSLVPVSDIVAKENCCRYIIPRMNRQKLMNCFGELDREALCPIACYPDENGKLVYEYDPDGTFTVGDAITEYTQNLREQYLFNEDGTYKMQPLSLHMDYETILYKCEKNSTVKLLRKNNATGELEVIATKSSGANTSVTFTAANDHFTQDELQADKLLIRVYKTVNGTQKLVKTDRAKDFVASSAPMSDKGFIWPLQDEKGVHITSYFGESRDVSGLNHFHGGIDIVLNSGNTYGKTVYCAAGNGKVVDVGSGGGYGQYIEIEHELPYTDGSTRIYHTLYAHLQPGSVTLRKGEAVSLGQGIGLAGYSGYTIPAGINGTHLHFEVIYEGVKENPLKYLPTT